ncbi:MAG: hypothetical protein ABIG44_17455 [Planctomycetota bacterium]
MTILIRTRANTPEVHCVRELHVEIPYELQARVMHFYCQLLGLPPWPPRDQIPGGRGVGNPRAGLYFQYRHDPYVDPMRRRLTLVVPSLATLEKRLSEYGWSYARHRGLGLTDEWLLLSDPVGHLLEIRQSQQCL